MSRDPDPDRAPDDRADDRSSGFKAFVPLEEARDRLLAAARPVDAVETVGLDAADDRIVAAPVRAPCDLPREDRAAMDGWAVRAEDTHGASERAPVTLTVAGGTGGRGGTAGAGAGLGPDERSPGVDAGQAVRVHTGSPLPTGADAVVMLEEAEVEDRDGEGGADGRLAVFAAVPPGRHVAARGEDVEAGDTLFGPGHRLRPSDLGLLLAVEVDAVEVHARPRVTVLPTGDEVVASDPGPGQTVESNGRMLAASLARWGCTADLGGIVPDDPDALEAALRGALEGKDPNAPERGPADVVLTVGGTSVGQRDLLPGVLDSMGDRLFHGVALRPGHPVGAWTVDDRPVVTVPGYPVAALATATLLVRPLVRAVGLRPDVPDPVVRARLARKVPSRVGDLHVVRVRLEATGDGPVAHPTRSKGAGVISSVTAADGVVYVPARSEGLDAGAEVEVVLWE